MAKAKTNRGSKGRPNTAPLPGIENGKVVKEISNAAAKFEALRDAWQAAGEKMNSAAEDLLEAMTDHGYKTYVDADNYDPPLRVTITQKDPRPKPKVDRVKTAEE